jgi:hypothetical protein
MIVLTRTILRDGKIIRSTELITLQIRKIVEPVMAMIFKGVPQMYHAEVAITAAGAAPTAKLMPKIPTTAKPVMVRT